MILARSGHIARARLLVVEAVRQAPVVEDPLLPAPAVVVPLRPAVLGVDRQAVAVVRIHTPLPEVLLERISIITLDIQVIPAAVAIIDIQSLIHLLIPVVRMLTRLVLAQRDLIAIL